ncbi:hypothetical protein H2509_16835 [Stappia sp. F7233]|uniref:Cysteine rich repeat-containing protein n=1 Tax=Stappia albiluteola TaxID=2758565 RepID=A0A839AGG3_9HYPH|nr:cysteine rich repeat-containing protein [Stappia albiluteola]MBA5778793.1 hypothetical protein [Stappia albiluteola]
MRRTTRILAAFSVAAGLGVGAASAETIGFAEAIKILGASCGADIEKYCKNVNLGGGRIQQCLVENEAKVSAQCKTDYAGVFALLQQRFAAQAAVEKVCNRDTQQYCKLTKPGKGNILKCLLKAEPSVSAKCNQAITDAGYR